MNSAKKVALVVAAVGAALGASVGTASAHDHGFHGAGAAGAAIGSSGLLSGNLLQLPENEPINACGNTLDHAGFLNPAFGNTCASI